MFCNNVADKRGVLVGGASNFPAGEAAYGQWIAPKDIPTFGIETITDDPNDYKLMARAK